MTEPTSGAAPDLIVEHRLHLWAFVYEVARQCDLALMAAEDLERACRTRDSARLWYSIQGLLASAANVSKMLWPAERVCPPDCPLPKSELIPFRGEVLRQILGITDSPLKSRALRNHFEHFDVRLEEWTLTSKEHNFIDGNVGAIDKLGVGAITDILRHYDPMTETAYFRGKPFPLRPVIEALRELRGRAGAVWEHLRNTGRMIAAAQAARPREAAGPPASGEP
jgi:hypothetical protein